MRGTGAFYIFHGFQLVRSSSNSVHCIPLSFPARSILKVTSCYFHCGFRSGRNTSTSTSVSRRVSKVIELRQKPSSSPEASTGRWGLLFTEDRSLGYKKYMVGSTAL